MKKIITILSLLLLVSVQAQQQTKANNNQQRLQQTAQRAQQAAKRAAQSAQQSINTVNGMVYNGVAPVPPVPPVATVSALAPLTALNGSVNYNYEGEYDTKNLTSKEISMEMNVGKTAEIYFENTQRTVEIKTWEQPKVKIVTTVWFEGEGKLSDEEWFEKLNISMKTLGTGIRIKSNTVSGGGSYYASGQAYAWSSGGGSSVAIFDGEGKNLGTKSNGKRIVTLYIPKDNKLDLESKYADVSIANPIKKLEADITNGNLELLGDINNLMLRSKYSNVTIDVVNTGEIDFINGNITIREAKDLELDTKYSNVEIGTAAKLNFTSNNDEYDIDEAGSIVGRKNYGNFRITKLSESLEMDGTNADVKVKNIASTVTAIKIDNKYADLRLPMRNIKNYSVDYEGPYSTIYANFEKKAKPTTNKTTKTSWSNNGCDDCASENNFTATVGTGAGTKVEVKCQNCTVDFK